MAGKTAGKITGRALRKLLKQAVYTKARFKHL